MLSSRHSYHLFSLNLTDVLPQPQTNPMETGVLSPWPRILNLNLIIIMSNLISFIPDSKTPSQNQETQQNVGVNGMYKS